MKMNESIFGLVDYAARCELIEEDDMLRTLKESATPQQWLSQMNRIILENGRGQEMDNYTAIAAFETGRGLFGRKTH